MIQKVCETSVFLITALLLITNGHSIRSDAQSQRFTVSGFTPDAALQCLRCATGAMVHSSTQQAFNNINAPSVANIGGHGASGALETGGGPNGPFNNNNLMILNNEVFWRSFVQSNQRKHPSLWIHSCSSGEGVNGANFLFRIANNLGANVYGRTCMIYCGNCRIDYSHGQWIGATPTSAPTPVNCPEPHFHTLNFDVESEHVLVQGQTTMLLSGQEFNALMTGSYDVSDGDPLAFLTHKVTLLKNNLLREEAKVWNGQWVQFDSDPQKFYKLNKTLDTSLLGYQLI